MTLHLNPDELAEHNRRRNREYMQRYRADHAGVSHWKPFLGCDGEGGGTDEHGRQNFLLLRIGHDELFRDNEPLSSADCLDAILRAPANAILVGYFFGYDSTMILKDLPPDRVKRLFEPFERGPGKSPYTYFRDRWAIDYRPKQYLRVARLQRDRAGKLRVVEGSSRTIWETGGFFQKSFVKAVSDWNIGTKYGRELIATTKERRGDFTEMTIAERRYCRMECEYLAAMMTEFRQACHDSGTMPATWSGAGAISAALHRDHQTPKRQELERLRQKRLVKMASAAYFGGRFEVTRTGLVAGPIWEYDISSAYPDAMRRLPCPVHTRWRRINGAASNFDMTQPFIADVAFRHDPDAALAHLPFRQKGRLYWPLNGRGTYWGWELCAAVATGDCSITDFHGGYYAEKRCDCRPYDWVERLYEQRKSLGKQARGYPLKLGLNALYGKLAQRQGGAPYRDLLAAGMITAMTRAKLIHAYTGAERSIVMLATDAVFSRQRLPLDIGPHLGQWEEKERPSGLFVVQPGVYWSPGGNDQPKTRGIPQSRIIAARASFEDAWKLHMDTLRRDPDGELYGPDTPAIGVGVTDFIGHRLALAQNNPLKAGRWIKHDRLVSFDWSLKRDPRARSVFDEAWTAPYAGHPGMTSDPYDPKAPDQLTELDQREMEMECDDDYYPWGNSGE